MTYVIASGCIDVKDRACVKCCPSTASTRAAHAVHPSGRVHQLRHLRVRLSDRSDPRRPGAAASRSRVRGDQPEGRTSAAWARLAARTACSPRPATIRWSRPIRRARVAVLSRVVRAYPRDGTLGPMLVPARPGSRAESGIATRRLSMHASVLKYFVEVARCGSIRKAAQNPRLCRLKPRWAPILAAGPERMLQHIRATLNDFHLMRGELDELKDERTGHVSVAAMDSLFVDLLPAAVEEFSGQYPPSRMPSPPSRPGMWRPRCSAASTTWASPSFPLPAGLDVMTQVALPPGVVMASSHPLARKDVVSFADCRSHAFLGWRDAFPCGRRVAEVLRILGSADPSVTCNSTLLLKRLIVTGRGISFLEAGVPGGNLQRRSGVASHRGAQYQRLTVGIVVPSQRPLSR